MISGDDAGKIVVRFSGRKLDFEDLKRSLEAQAATRAEDCPVELVFEQNKINFSLNDKTMMDNIEYVKEKMLSDEFKSIMSDAREGKTFLVIHDVLANLNYSIRYRVLRASEYGGVPQIRDRIYIVAFRDQEDCDRFEFPSKMNSFTFLTKSGAMSACTPPMVL